MIISDKIWNLYGYEYEFTSIFLRWNEDPPTTFREYFEHWTRRYRYMVQNTHKKAKKEAIRKYSEYFSLVEPDTCSLNPTDNQFLEEFYNIIIEEFGWKHYPSQDDFENVKEAGYILTDNKEIYEIQYRSDILDIIDHIVFRKPSGYSN